MTLVIRKRTKMGRATSVQRLTPPTRHWNCDSARSLSGILRELYCYRDLLRRLMARLSIFDQDRDLGLPVLWIWLIRRADKVVLDTSLPSA